VAGVHDTNGSPLNPLGHWQTVTWLRTSHSASTPHDVEQGLMHLELTHTLFDAHSSLLRHSTRRQFVYGSPSKPERHAHTARKLRATHSALEPQGKLAHKSDDWRKLLEPLGDEPTKLLVKLDGDENELSREPLFRMRPLVSPESVMEHRVNGSPL